MAADPAGRDGITARTSVDVENRSTIAVLVNRTVNELLGRYGSAPTPPAQGDTPSRPSRVTPVFYLLPGGGYWEEPRMGAKLALAAHPAASPRGAQLPDDDRMNIDRGQPSSTAEVLSYISAPTTEAIPGA